MIRKLYPGGKRKAFNITYDDGILQDVRFVELLNRYGIPGTFNLNSGLMEQEFQWVHPCGMTITRLPLSAAKGLYRGHEVASHTRTHPYMDQLNREQLLAEMQADKQTLEAAIGREVAGFAVPFDYYSDLIRQCVREAGFEYGRNSQESRSFTPQADPFSWSATLFHLNPKLEETINAFLESDVELAVCQLVGHAYDLDTENMWEPMKEILRRVSTDPDVVCMTHIDLVRYLNAMKQIEIADDRIINNSGVPLWFEIDGNIQCI